MKEDLRKIAKKLKKIEYLRDTLQTLIYIKNNQTGKPHPQIKIQQEFLERNICPFCLNQINWEKLEKLITKYEKEIEIENKKIPK